MLEKNKLKTRRTLLLIMDAVLTVIASFAALYTRLELHMDETFWMFWESYCHFIWIDIIVSCGVFYIFRLYHSIWKFAGVIELQQIVKAGAAIVFAKFAVFFCLLDMNIPRSWYIYDPILQMLLVAGVRFLYRSLRSARERKRKRKHRGSYSNVMIVGAGKAGNALLKEINFNNEIDKVVVCMIDDARSKQHTFMNGVPVVGTRNDIVEKAEKYKIDEIYIAMPSSSVQERKEIIEIAKNTDCELKTLPGIYQLINGEVSFSKLRKVEVEDLLGREPIKVDLDRIATYVRDKIVMVTGGGGSIGSELCRQVAKNQPKQLIIVDIYENNAYDIQNELLRNYPELNLQVRIASVRDEKKINQLFEEFRPEIVYHAAAHKHVPLMEDSPCEAVKNNVFGTLHVVKAADMYGTKKFVMISTDKAVNPTNIMGATKRICEMIIQMANRHSHTDYVAVRFGNVLGSNGSVIPLFRKQILNGGPVTVTHKDIIRYFMTIPEAVSLVMEAGAFATGGEIFVLDMGDPVKIDDLARNMIRLSGLTPDVDIDIVYTGLRPGEKLYEELLMDEEGLQKTENLSIYIGKPIEFDEERFYQQLKLLKEVISDSSINIREMVREIVPTYHYE